MKRKFRLTRSTDFKRVRRTGNTYAHPLIVLVVSPNQSGDVRFGISAGRSVGHAVQRNKCKRQLREAIRPLLPQVKPGWDGVLIARRPLTEANLAEIRAAVTTLLRKAHLIHEPVDSPSLPG